MNDQPHERREPDGLTRRRLVAGTAAAIGLAMLRRSAFPQTGPAPPPSRPLGGTATVLGARAPQEKLQRIVFGTMHGMSLTPLQDLHGIITPSDLHYERHHAGVPAIDPHEYKLLIHGMVDRPTVFDLEALKRFPAVSRFHFLECSGNGSSGYTDVRPDQSPQVVDGLTSTSEWTGVSLSTLLREVGVHPRATWFLAEGGDAALMARSIPIAKAWDDAMIAYGQNGEALRPEQGYPARLLLPGWEGNTNVKWIRRLEFADRPFMTRDETSKYTDPLPNGTARMFSFVMDAKSIITSPAYPAALTGHGWWDVTGLAWSGRGRISRVDVSTDGGTRWSPAVLEQPVLPKCHTRFTFPWKWDGAEALLMSRATDETGYVQPTLAELRRVRGLGTNYHFNNMRAWRVRRDGSVLFGLEG
ncbi:MAG TPA: sulfite dehydrogenase [Gemmatimonadaceae bacterium]|jgi:sulfane dehydrogenase subunit SoxC|nr:sulfite dehydrogenase [Gemmatimonadaceae bacterium]